MSTTETGNHRNPREFNESWFGTRKANTTDRGKQMKTTSLILTLAVASLISLEGVSTRGPKKVAEAAPQKITIMYGDVPVSVSVDSFQMPLNQLF